MILRKRFRNFLFYFCKTYTLFFYIRNTQNDYDFKIHNILQQFRLFLFLEKNGIGIVLY